jgi:hypothetical protein
MPIEKRQQQPNKPRHTKQGNSETGLRNGKRRWVHGHTNADVIDAIYQRFDSQISALYYYRINRFIKPLEEMSGAVLSDDESDHEQGTRLGQSHYVIVNEAWRSKELAVWLRTIDLLACGEKWGGHNVARQGNSRRIRRHSTRSKGGIAISGLPENCYDSEWLNSLQCYQRDKLDVQPPVDLTFSDEEKRYDFPYTPCAFRL